MINKTVVQVGRSLLHCSYALKSKRLKQNLGFQIMTVKTNIVFIIMDQKPPTKKVKKDQ